MMCARSLQIHQNLETIIDYCWSHAVGPYDGWVLGMSLRDHQCSLRDHPEQMQGRDSVRKGGLENLGHYFADKAIN